MANEKNNIQHKRSILHKNNKQSRNRKTKHQPTGKKIHNNLKLQRTKRSKHRNRTKLKTQKNINHHTPKYDFLIILMKLLDLKIR